MARTSSFRSPRAARHSLDGGIDGVEPRLRVLLEMAGRQPFDEAVALRGAGEHRAVREIERDGLGALGPTVDAKGNHIVDSRF